MSAPTRLVIAGYGKMGKLIDQLAPEYQFETVARITSANADEPLPAADVAIEFSGPHAAPATLRRLLAAKLPIVCGSTGWFDHLPDIAAYAEQQDGALVWSPNFSAGVAVFRRLAGLAAGLLNSDPAYGAWAWEIHHDAKRDAPSGTLLALVEAMRQSGYDRTIDVSSSRAGRHPGTHEIGFDSAADTITLRHTARSREGFARGALQSARWLIGRKGVFTFDDVLFGPG